MDHRGERWLRDIYDYIAEDDPDAASRVVQGNLEHADALSRFPDLGHRYRDQPGRHIRTLLYGRYRIAYLVKENGNIDIIGMFHGAMRIDRYLR